MGGQCIGICILSYPPLFLNGRIRASTEKKPTKIAGVRLQKNDRFNLERPPLRMARLPKKARLFNGTSHLARKQGGIKLPVSCLSVHEPGKPGDDNSIKCQTLLFRKTIAMLRTNTPFKRQFASHSLLIPWQTSPYPLYKGVLCYPPP